MPVTLPAARIDRTPPDEQLVVHVVVVDIPAVARRLVGDGQFVRECRALRTDHPEVHAGQDDEVRPGVGDEDLPLRIPRFVCFERLFPGGPAQFVEESGPQGTGERGSDAGVQRLSNRLLGNREHFSRQPAQRLENTAPPVERGQLRRDVLPADLAHPFGEHRPSTGGPGQGDDGLRVARPVVLGAAEPERPVEAAVGFQGDEIAPVFTGCPRHQGEAVTLLGLRHRYAQGQQLVEEVHIADRGRQQAAGGLQFGAQRVGHAVDEWIKLCRSEAVVGPPQLQESASPSGRTVGGTHLGGQGGVAEPGGGTGLLQQVQPLGQFFPLPP